ncbi:unnamed protein product [Dibothriocephalus latus]|uniref:EF-hand domain-containing protein n=1 Tax=Dibothriocephalus latus TaxID=60516 RepID=A0A3P6S542_DIBLA|nr:unnamed protein product [Dibothriocephalus latus]
MLKCTQFTRRELQIIYRGFKQDCPTGQLTEDIFKVIYGKFFPQGDASMYAHFVFRTFDHCNMGKLSFEQLVRCLSTLIHGSTHTKLMWIFHLYDIDGDGVITRSEMLKVIHSIYDLLGKHTDPPYDDNTLKEHMESVFQRLDLNQDGILTPDEFMQACQNDPNICEALGCLQTQGRQKGMVGKKARKNAVRQMGNGSGAVNFDQAAELVQFMT